MADTRPPNALVFRALAPDPAQRGDLTLNPRARFEKLDARAREHVKATEDRVERMLERHEGLRTLREKLRADAELSALGRARKLRAAGDELLELLGKETAGLQVGESLHREKQAKITAAPPLERDDAVGALRDMEYRGFVRSLSASERSKLLADATADPRIIEAIVRAPAPISGVGPEVWSRLEQKARIARHGPELAKLEAEGVAVGAWRECIDLVRADVKRAVDVAEREAAAPEKPVA
jgi:hypothetical protein